MQLPYKIVSSILLSMLIPYVNEITEMHQCGFDVIELLERYSLFVR